MTAPIPSPLARAHAELRAVLADDEPYRQQVPLVAGAGRVGAPRGWAGELAPLGVGEEALEHRVALPATGKRRHGVRKRAEDLLRSKRSRTEQTARAFLEQRRISRAIFSHPDTTDPGQVQQPEQTQQPNRQRTSNRAAGGVSAAPFRPSSSHSPRTWTGCSQSRRRVRRQACR